MIHRVEGKEPQAQQRDARFLAALLRVCLASVENGVLVFGFRWGCVQSWG